MVAGVQLLDESQAALKRYPMSLDKSREELQKLEESQPGSIMADILRVRIQEQKVLNRTVYQMQQRKVKLLGKPF